MKNSDLIHFDWAIKNILRDKENFCILEGLFSLLLNRKVKIMEVLESESNQQTSHQKFNRVDMMVKDDRGELFIVEVQLSRDLYFMQRILFGTSKAISEHIKVGESYKNVKKIYSINVLYFDLGKGADFIYHGKTTFTGMFKKDELQIQKREKEFISGEKKYAENVNIFPEYYLIRLNQFNGLAQNNLEEWIQFLKTGEINKDTTAPGLREAQEKLRVIRMTDQERKEYEDHLDAIMTQNDTIDAYKEEGILEGLERGRTQGLEEGLERGRAQGLEEGLLAGVARGEKKKTIEIARNMKREGMNLEQISLFTHLSISELKEL